jgi:hypothetical protein
MLDGIPERSDDDIRQTISDQSGGVESPMELSTPMPLPVRLSGQADGDPVTAGESSPTYQAVKRHLSATSERTSPVSERPGQLPPSPPASITGLTEGVR